MNYSNRKWVIITLADYTSSQLQALIEDALQTSTSTLRKSLDNSKAILKWDGDTPTVFNGMATYTHSEIKAILRGSDWEDQDA